MLGATVKDRKTQSAAPAIGIGLMAYVLIITEDDKTAAPLREKIVQSGYDCSFVSYDEAQDMLARRLPNLILVDINPRIEARAWDIVLNIKKQPNLPVIGWLPAEMLTDLDNYHEIDDFIVCPCGDAELLLRIKRLLKKTQETDNTEQIQCSGLTIDLATCEVTVDGTKADLTFKEYELLKLMASNRGRVFTREALLDKIWGYDYFGGDRTVDVHMRRLRSKIEDANHTYIETVRNIGYRFIKDNRL